MSIYAQHGGVAMRIVERDKLLEMALSVIGFFRLATRQDIKPGARLFVAHVLCDERGKMDVGLPEPILLEARPLTTGRQGEHYVCFYCVDTPQIHCVVSLRFFADPVVEANQGGRFYTTLFLAPKG